MWNISQEESGIESLVPQPPPMSVRYRSFCNADEDIDRVGEEYDFILHKRPRTERPCMFEVPFARLTDGPDGVCMRQYASLLHVRGGGDAVPVSAIRSRMTLDRRIGAVPSLAVYHVLLRRLATERLLSEMRPALQQMIADGVRPRASTVAILMGSLTFEHTEPELWVSEVPAIGERRSMIGVASAFWSIVASLNESDGLSGALRRILHGLIRASAANVDPAGPGDNLLELATSFCTLHASSSLFSTDEIHLIHSLIALRHGATDTCVAIFEEAQIRHVRTALGRAILRSMSRRMVRREAPAAPAMVGYLLTLLMDDVTSDNEATATAEGFPWVDMARRALPGTPLQQAALLVACAAAREIDQCEVEDFWFSSSNSVSDESLRSAAHFYCTRRSLPLLSPNGCFFHWILIGARRGEPVRPCTALAAVRTADEDAWPYASELAVRSCGGDQGDVEALCRVIDALLSRAPSLDAYPLLEEAHGSFTRRLFGDATALRRLSLPALSVSAHITPEELVVMTLVQRESLSASAAAPDPKTFFVMVCDHTALNALAETNANLPPSSPSMSTEVNAFASLMTRYTTTGVLLLVTAHGLSRCSAAAMRMLHAWLRQGCTWLAVLPLALHFCSVVTERLRPHLFAAPETASCAAIASVFKAGGCVKVALVSADPSAAANIKQFGELESDRPAVIILSELLAKLFRR